LLGTYDPCSEPPIAKIDIPKASQWLKKGAQPTPSVMQILNRGGVFQKSSPPAQ
jgi:small subunit ribosomal protein S16